MRCRSRAATRQEPEVGGVCGQDGQSGVHGGWGVVDDYPAAVATFNSRYPQIKATVAKALFVVDR